MASAQVELNDKLQNGTAAAMNNYTKADMLLIRSHSWSGHFVSLPKTIPQGHDKVTHFHHLKGSQGSMAAVSYTATNEIGALLAVILAWSAPANFNPSSAPNKVYGVCGPKALIDAMTWDEIHLHLVNAGSTTEYNNGICMSAAIINLDIPTSKMANLLATFQLCP